MFFLKEMAACLLGLDQKNRGWLTELYGDCELKLSQEALKMASRYRTVAYLDPLENINGQRLRPDLLLKPSTLDEAVLMSTQMLNTKIIDLVIIDSPFLLPSQQINAEKSLVCLAKAAEKNEKPVFLLNPNNAIRKLVSKSLEAFCDQQFYIK